MIGDIINPGGGLISWDDDRAQGVPNRCRVAFQDLAARLIHNPTLDPSQALREFYVDDAQLTGGTFIWQFMLPPAQLTVAWIPFMNHNCPVRTFKLTGIHLVPTCLLAPVLLISLWRIVALNQGGAKLAVHGGVWMEGNLLLTQYNWKNGTPLGNTSMHQLRGFLLLNQVRAHPAIRNWETELGCPLPESIWLETWVSCRAAKENAFLWQIIFRAFATLSWHFPTKLQTDPTLWCTRCTEGLREDHLHCIWSCAASGIGARQF